MADAIEPDTTTETATVTETDTSAETLAAELATLTDEQIETVITEATDAAQAATADGVEFTPDTEAAFEAALSRVTAARAELNARIEKRNRLTAARAQAAQLAATRPTPAAPMAPVVPSVAEITKTTPIVPADTKRSGLSFSLVVPSDANNLVDGRAAGTEYASLTEVGYALDRRSQNVGQIAKGTKSADFGLLQIRRTDTEFTVTRDESDDAVVQRARNPKRLAGGGVMQAWRKNALDRAGGDERMLSLTAAAGWCAPSTTLYDLCEMESLDGILELPEVTATRGGIRWTQEPTYPQLDAATAFTNLTEAQVIANTAKNCAAIPCPTFEDTRLGVAVTCLTGSLLQAQGYPELVARVVRGELVVHAHKLNEAIIAALVARAGAATVIGAPAGDPATSAILSAVELAAEDIRARHRLAFDAVIEVVLPHWVIPVLRADFTRRNAGDPGLTNARIMEWFQIRGVRPQFVRDWQDFYSGVAAPSVGGPAPFITAFPTTVNFLAFPAGGVVLARQDVITLRNVYDSTNLAQNLYTELFFEEGWAPIYPCPEIRQYTAFSCPSGATAAQIDLDCAA